MSFFQPYGCFGINVRDTRIKAWRCATILPDAASEQRKAGNQLMKRLQIIAAVVEKS